MNTQTLRVPAVAIAASALTAAVFSWSAFAEPSATQSEAPLAHMVFFTLEEPSEENADALVKACHTYLNGHKGTVHFSVGRRIEELDREVNDTDFDVALHLIFASEADHDTYQTHPRHLEFIEKNNHLWSTVRVFDSFLDTQGSAELPSAKTTTDP